MVSLTVPTGRLVQSTQSAFNFFLIAVAYFVYAPASLRAQACGVLSIFPLDLAPRSSIVKIILKVIKVEKAASIYFPASFY